jgi:hypothetical protein
MLTTFNLGFRRFHRKSVFENAARILEADLMLYEVTRGLFIIPFELIVGHKHTE